MAQPMKVMLQKSSMRKSYAKLIPGVTYRSAGADDSKPHLSYRHTAPLEREKITADLSKKSLPISRLYSKSVADQGLL